MGNDVFKKSFRPYILFLAFFIVSAQGQIKDTTVDCSDWTMNDPKLFPVTIPEHSVNHTVEKETPSTFLTTLYAIASEKNSKNFYDLVKSSQWERVGFEDEDRCELYKNLNLRLDGSQETISFCETGKKSKIDKWDSKDGLAPIKIFGGSIMLPKKIWTPSTCREGYNRIRSTLSGLNKKPRFVVDIAINDNDEKACFCECNPRHSCAILDKSSVTNDFRLAKIGEIFPNQDLLLCSNEIASFGTRLEIFVRTFSPELKTKPFSCTPRA